ncbi:hypothetical protein E2542_SST22941 [Spatholobus suberectus]|nr:hypothetical protein E2542_SST22941 [Spatholobus suberectus]
MPFQRRLDKQRGNHLLKESISAIVPGQLTSCSRLKGALMPIPVQLVDDEAVASLLFIPGRGWERNQKGEPLQISRKHIRTIAQIWTVFLYFNINPYSHTSDLTVGCADFIYGILARMDIDIEVVISFHIKLAADLGGLAKLGFLVLVTMLCQSKKEEFLARVQWPTEARDQPVDQEGGGALATGDVDKEMVECISQEDDFDLPV